ncbi:hypothetical protein QAD02_016967 [Eretmocerus hayati]|uniref:Uncharacterized protein n=1 Tax=Eretmocerus hayati TaxID=131215 RepID=A0ACC2PHF0_9HYME|nr:hypothetical protein QAD02_016967 [Eretmocerus hayati]
MLSSKETGQPNLDQPLKTLRRANTRIRVEHWVAQSAVWMNAPTGVPDLVPDSLEVRKLAQNERLQPPTSTTSRPLNRRRSLHGHTQPCAQPLGETDGQSSEPRGLIAPGTGRTSSPSSAPIILGDDSAPSQVIGTCSSTDETTYPIAAEECIDEFPMLRPQNPRHFPGRDVHVVESV